MPTNATRESSGRTTATSRRIFLSRTSDLGRPHQPGSLVAAVLRMARAGPT